MGLNENKLSDAHNPSDIVAKKITFILMFANN